MKYKLYRAVYSTANSRYRKGDYEEMAISDDVIDPPEDFFVGGHDGVENIGEIEIDGDTHLLPESFSFRDGLNL